MIIGGVALSIVGIGAVAWAVQYFRNGGTIGGFLSKVKSEQGNIAKFAGALPISAEAKAKLTEAIADPTSLVPVQAQAAFEQINEKKESLLQSLPPQFSSVVTAKEAELRQKGHELLSYAPVSTSSVSAVHETVQATAQETVAVQAAAQETVATQATQATQAAVHVAIKPEDLEAFRAFLVEKAATNQ